MLSFKFVGHMRDDAENHDKVWGVIYLEDNITNWNAKCITFWGRRGKKLQTKLGRDDYEMTKLVDNKIRKGYREIDTNRLNQVYPEFQNDLEKTAMWAMLKL